MLHCEVMPRAGSSRLGIGEPDMRFSHCLRPSNVREYSRRNQKNRGINAIWAISSAGKSEILFCESLMVGMRRRKHKVVTSRHRRGVEAISKADSFHDTLPLELAVRAGLSSKTKHLALDRIRPYPSPTPSITVAARRGASVAFEPYRRRCKSSPWRGVPHVQPQPALTRRSRSDC